jgi:hypothetical protein
VIGMVVLVKDPMAHKANNGFLTSTRKIRRASLNTSARRFAGCEKQQQKVI